MWLCTPEQSVSTDMSSLIPTCTPMQPINSSIVVTSCKCGKLPTRITPCANKVAAKIGSAEFFAPEIRTSPSKRQPPSIRNFSMIYCVLFSWCRSTNGDRMNATIGNIGVQDFINKLLAFNHIKVSKYFAYSLYLIFIAITVNIPLNTGLRSEEHTSELQSRPHLVCRLLLEKKKATPTSLRAPWSA